MPQVIVNKAKWKEGIEGLELFRKLAKQVLSQLSYTPKPMFLFILNQLRILAPLETAQTVQSVPSLCKINCN
jgi:hypothetical protein